MPARGYRGMRGIRGLSSGIELFLAALAFYPHVQLVAARVLKLRRVNGAAHAGAARFRLPCLSPHGADRGAAISLAALLDERVPARGFRGMRGIRGLSPGTELFLAALAFYPLYRLVSQAETDDERDHPTDNCQNVGQHIYRVPENQVD